MTELGAVVSAICLLASEAGTAAADGCGEASTKLAMQVLGFSSGYPSFAWAVSGTDAAKGEARAELHAVQARGKMVLNAIATEPSPADPQAILERLETERAKDLAALELAGDLGTELYKSGTALQTSFTISGKRYLVRLAVQGSAPDQDAELTLARPGGVPTIIGMYRGGFEYSLNSIRLSRSGAQLAVICKRTRRVAGGLQREHLVALVFPSDAAKPAPGGDAERRPGLPRFGDFPASETCSGRPAPVDLDSDRDARKFKTRLQEGARKGPDFAGCYTVVSWGCGTECESFVVIEARSGRVFSPPFSLGLGSWYRKDSALFVANPVDSDGAPPWAVSEFFVWTGQRLEPLLRSTVPMKREDLE
jgi:hypothetical protein